MYNIETLCYWGHLSLGKGSGKEEDAGNPITVVWICANKQ